MISDHGLGQRCFASGRRQSCQNPTDRSTWQSQPASGRFGYDLCSSDPAGPALGRQQACAPPQPICHNAGRQGERLYTASGAGGSGATITRFPTGDNTRTPDGRHWEHRRRRAKSIDPAGKWLRYTTWIQAIQHRWILKFDTQMFFSSSIEKNELVLPVMLLPVKGGNVFGGECGHARQLG